MHGWHVGSIEPTAGVETGNFGTSTTVLYVCVGVGVHYDKLDTACSGFDLGGFDNVRIPLQVGVQDVRGHGAKGVRYFKMKDLNAY